MMSFPGRAVDACEKREMRQRLDQVLGQAIHSAVVGSECARAEANGFDSIDRDRNSDPKSRLAISRPAG
jgi:hypothetical protein